jgi:hypothetical protein
MLANRVPIIGNNDLIISPKISEEEELIEIQLKKLKEKSRYNELTLDETRKLDLFLKNKRQLKEDQQAKKPNQDSSITLPAKDIKELLKMATAIDVTPEDKK